MKNNQLGVCFAHAFYPLVEAKIIESIKSLEDIMVICCQHGELEKFFNHPLFSRDEKIKTAQTIFEGSFTPEVQRLILLLIERRKMNILPHIIEELKSLYLERSDILQVNIKSAYELSDSEKSQVLEIVSIAVGKKVIPVFSVDPALIAGFIVTIGNRVFDNSIKTRLNQIKEGLGAYTTANYAN